MKKMKKKKKKKYKVTLIDAYHEDPPRELIIEAADQVEAVLQAEGTPVEEYDRKGKYTPSPRDFYIEGLEELPSLGNHWRFVGDESEIWVTEIQ